MSMLLMSILLMSILLMSMLLMSILLTLLGKLDIETRNDIASELDHLASTLTDKVNHAHVGGAPVNSTMRQVEVPREDGNRIEDGNRVEDGNRISGPERINEGRVGGLLHLTGNPLREYSPEFSSNGFDVMGDGLRGSDACLIELKELKTEGLDNLPSPKTYPTLERSLKRSEDNSSETLKFLAPFDRRGRTPPRVSAFIEEGRTLPQDTWSGPPGNGGSSVSAIEEQYQDLLPTPFPRIMLWDDEHELPSYRNPSSYTEPNLPLTETVHVDLGLHLCKRL